MATPIGSPVQPVYINEFGAATPCTGAIGGGGGGIPTNTVTFAKYTIDNDGRTVKFNWQDPNDTVIGKFKFAAWKATIVVAKKNEVPQNVSDGVVLITSSVRNQYAITPCEVDLEDAASYRFRAFPVTWNGVYNLEENYNIFSTQPTIIYGFTIDESKSDEADMVKPLAGCANVGYSNLKMDFLTDTLNWGSWKDAFFMPRPCMLRYDGTVAYYLDPDNYELRADGITASDVKDIAFEGNAMLEWCPVFTSASKVGDIITVRISNKRVDDSFECFSCKTADGTYGEHFYTPIYEGTLDASGRLRSISTNTIPAASKTIAQFRAAAKLNDTDVAGWDINTWADEDLIRALGVLITGRLNFEKSISNFVGSSSSGLTNKVGTANDKGMFYGHSSTSAVNMKFFGMENWWGHRWRATVGMVMTNNKWYCKMTRSRADGSTVDDYIDYSTTTDWEKFAAGYIDTGIPCTGGSDSPITKMYGSMPKIDGTSKVKFSAMFLPTAASGGSRETYYCDSIWGGTWTNNVSEFWVGGSVNNGSACGLFTVYANVAASYSGWNDGASLSYRPF